jgi:hypothetical protein
MPRAEFFTSGDQLITEDIRAHQRLMCGKRGHTPRRQFAFGVECRKRLEVGEHRICVLVSGYAERVQDLHGSPGGRYVPAGGVLYGFCQRRLRERRCTFQEQTGGFAIFRIPNDLTVLWIGSVSVDAHDFQGVGIHPAAVLTVVSQHHRIVGTCRIQRIARGLPVQVADNVAAPNASRYPLTGSDLGSPLGNDGENLFERKRRRNVRFVEVGLSAAGMVVVNVNDAGHHHAAAKIDGSGRWSLEGIHFSIGADCDHLAVGYRDGIGPPPAGVDGVNRAIAEDQIGFHWSSHAGFGPDYWLGGTKFALKMLRPAARFGALSDVAYGSQSKLSEDRRC